MDDVELVRKLLDLPLFENLDYSQVAGLFDASNRRQVGPGEVLCESRTVDDRLLVLVEGELRLESAEGLELFEMKPVRVLGEMGVFTGQTRSSRVVAAGPATLLDLDRNTLQELLEEDPQMGNHMLANLIKLLYGRLHDVNEEMEMLRNQAQRLKKRLKALAPDDPLLKDLFPEGGEDAKSR